MTQLRDKFSANLHGIIYMIVATALLTGMSALARVVGEELHPFQVAFFRNFLGFFLMAPLFLRYGLAPLKTKKMGLMVARGIFNGAAMLMFFMALGMMPLAEISALSFTIPLFVALLAVFLLKEKMGPRRTISLIVGFSGAVIIVRPGFEIIDLGAVLALASAASWAIAVIVIKQLSRTDSSITITLYGLLFLTLFTLPPALLFWEWPTGEQYLWLLGVAATGTIGQILFAQSLKNADATLVMPFDFTKLLWAALIGVVFFAETPTIWTLGGGLVIFVSATYLTYREGREGKDGKNLSEAGAA